MASPSQSGRARTAWLATGCGLAAAYVLPLYLPPSIPLGGDGYFARQFPGVPPAWLVARLAALGLAAIAFALALRHDAARPPRQRSCPAAPPRPPFLIAALAVAAALLLAALVPQHLGPWSQSAFALALPLPALLTHLAYRRKLRPAPPRATLVCVALFAAWTMLRLTSGWDDARAATPVDSWLNFKSFRDALAQSDNLLTGRFEPGMPDFVHVLNGGSLLVSLGIPASYPFLRLVGVLWLAIAAGALFTLVRGMADRKAATVAVCALLASPLTLLSLLTPMPLPFGIGMSGALFALFHRYYRSHSPAALVALGTLGGFSATIGHTAIPCAVLGPATLWLMWQRRSQVPAPVLATAAIAALATLLPTMPNLDDIARMRSHYFDRFVAWPVVEGVLLGQLDPMTLLEAPPQRRPLEVAATALLAPLACARTPLRLWGDVFLEPITVVLGLLAAGGLRRRGILLSDRGLLFAGAALALLPGLTSSYDRPSLIRMLALPFLVSAIAGLGFDAVAPRHAGRRSVAAAILGAALLASGLGLFDISNRRIVARSWVSLGLEATRFTDASGIIFLDTVLKLNTDFLNVAEMTTELRRRPIRHLAYTGTDVLRRHEGSLPAAVYVWSPAHEMLSNLGATLCELEPTTRRFQLVDEAGLSRAWAATTAENWQPALPEGRWREFACATELHAPRTPSR